MGAYFFSIMLADSQTRRLAQHHQASHESPDADASPALPLPLPATSAAPPSPLFAVLCFLLHVHPLLLFPQLHFLSHTSPSPSLALPSFRSSVPRSPFPVRAFSLSPFQSAPPPRAADPSVRQVGRANRERHLPRLSQALELYPPRWNRSQLADERKAWTAWSRSGNLAHEMEADGDGSACRRGAVRCGCGVKDNPVDRMVIASQDEE
jgi:hypothetical protein